MKEVIWTPSQSYVEKTNVYRFMKTHGIASFDELSSRSRKDIEWFWDAVVRDLKIEFFKPYKKVLDTSKGIQWAKWFTGGTTNIAYNCVERHAKSARRGQNAIVWEGEDGNVVKLTYQELNDKVDKVADFLSTRGIKKGDRVGVYMPMIPEAVIAIFGIIKAGCIYIPIFSGYGPDAVAARLKDAGAKALFSCNGFYRKGKEVILTSNAYEAVKRTPSIEMLVFVERLAGRVALEGGVVSWDEVMRRQVKPFRSLEMDSEDPFMIIYTSGTTGRPKGAVHVHGGFMVKIAEEVAYQTDLRDKDILFWYTDTGWIMAPWELVGGLALGGTVFCYEGMPDYPSPDRLWSMIERHRITTLGISPTAIRALRKYGDENVTRHDLSSLRILGSTGEPWDKESYMWFFNVVGGGLCPVINLSGGTEVGACFLSPHPVTPLTPCTLGGPSLGMDMDVFDDEGLPLRGAVGELVCRKPWPGMTRGLWKDPERYIETYWSRWNGVWLHGDWASIDSNGYWYLHGRSDDTIKVAGKRIGPAEVETVLTKHPAVVESAAIGVPDELKGESIMCFVVLKDHSKASEAVKREIATLVAAELGKTMVPKEIRFVTMLPKTRNAKILRRLIKSKVLGKPLGDLSNLENPQSLDEIVR